MTAAARQRDLFLTEILGQPGALRRAGRAVVEQADRLDALGLTWRGRRRVVLTGMGSSYDACHALATALAGEGVMATMVNAAELLHFRTAALGPDDLLLIVSQSGESAEVVRLVERLRARDDRPFLAAVTNGLANPLATRADLAIDTWAGPERGPSTMTFAATLVVLTAIGRVLGGAGTPDVDGIAGRTARDAEAAAAAAARLLAAPEEQAAALERWLDGRRMLTALGRGVARAAAEMGALTLKEAAGFPAESLETADFRHGPLELVGPDLAVALFDLERQTDHLDRSLAAELVGAGAAVLFVGPGGGAPEGAESVAIDHLARVIAPAVALVPLQLLAWRLAVTGGRRPGEFTVASKVTTRE